MPLPPNIPRKPPLFGLFEELFSIGATGTGTGTDVGTDSAGAVISSFTGEAAIYSSSLLYNML